MVLGLCPVSIRAEAASADTVQVQEAPETESKQSSPVDEEPVITGTGSEGEQPSEDPVIIGTGEEQGAANEEVKQEETKQETKQEQIKQEPTQETKQDVTQDTAQDTAQDIKTSYRTAGIRVLPQKGWRSYISYL